MAATVGHMWGDVQWPGPTGLYGARHGPAAAACARTAGEPLGERHLTEDLLDPAQVPHPGLGGAAYPAAHRLHGHAELAGRSLLGQALPAQRGRHPLRERGGLAGLAE